MTDIKALVYTYKAIKEKLKCELKFLEILETYVSIEDNLKANVIKDTPRNFSYSNGIEEFIESKEKTILKIEKLKLKIKHMELFLLEFDSKINSLTKLERFIIINKHIKLNLTNRQLLDLIEPRISKKTLERRYKSAIEKIFQGSEELFD